MLTRNEQRVIVLSLLVLLAVAFVRYRHNAQSFPPNKATTSPALAAPLPLDESVRGDDESDEAKPHGLPSPKSSP